MESRCFEYLSNKLIWLYNGLFVKQLEISNLVWLDVHVFSPSKSAIIKLQKGLSSRSKCVCSHVHVRLRILDSRIKIWRSGLQMAVMRWERQVKTWISGIAKLFYSRYLLHRADVKRETKISSNGFTWIIKSFVILRVIIIRKIRSMKAFQNKPFGKNNKYLDDINLQRAV